MKLSVLAVALCLSVAFAVKITAPFGSEDELKEAFLFFQKNYGRSYASNAEFEQRYTIFKQNMAKAEENSRKNPFARFGVTKFSDMTEEEQARWRMPSFNETAYSLKLSQMPRKSSFPRHPTVTPDPTNFDWGSAGVVTAVRNQGQCGSCWAFSATETIESYYALGGGQLQDLSVEQIVSCDTQGEDQGCDGGFPSGAYQYVQGAGGIESESDYPYSASEGSAGECQFNSGDIVAHVTGYNSLSGESGLYQQLSTAGPVSVCVDASSWSSYQGGVLTSCGNDVDHCVQATGYYNYGAAFGTAYWNVRNSWGTDWGVNGYIQVGIGQDLCDIGDYCTIVSAN